MTNSLVNSLGYVRIEVLTHPLFYFYLCTFHIQVAYIILDQTYLRVFIHLGGKPTPRLFITPYFLLETKSKGVINLMIVILLFSSIKTLIYIIFILLSNLPIV
jgi:hypothetical protein